jgi:hypothetical protein
LNESDSRKKVEAKGAAGEEKQKLSVYYDGESVAGEVFFAIAMEISRFGRAWV